MALLAPRVIAPLSECSTHVRVQGQITGSTVEVLENGTTVGGSTATWSDQYFALNPGITLAPGARVTAVQTLGPDVSPASPEPVEVQRMPPTIGGVGFRSHLYVCGECLWLDGMVPGAEVQVKVGGVVTGVGRAHDGTARIGLSAPIGPGEIVEVQQTACGMTGPGTVGPPPEGVPIQEGQRQLPAPRVIGPLKECQRAVRVADVFEGSQVTLDRTVGPDSTACFDASSLWFRVDPLVLGETVTARQAFPSCRLTSPDAPPITVESAEPVPPPTVIAPLCDGATTVTITGLLPGSRVRISQDGIELGIGEAPDQDSFGFPVPPLTGGSTITAEQELCNIWSVPSNEVLVDPQPGSLPQPIIPGPLFECASVVRVTNLYPGVRVYVYSNMLAGPIGQQQVYATEADVPVNPQLIAGDEIFAVQVGCGHTSQSDPQTVSSLERLPVPRVQRHVDECMRAVPVTNVVPGARVDVYVNDVWRGSKDAGADEVEVPISGRLRVGDRVKARQRLCAMISGFSQDVVVVRSTGKWYVAGLKNSQGQDTNAEVLAVHAALLRTGHIIYFGGDQNDTNENDAGRTNPARVDATRLFDCNSPHINSFRIDKVGSPTSDVFCCGQALMGDGRLIVGGGTEDFPAGGDMHGHGHGAAGHFIGHGHTWVFNPATRIWTEVQHMNPQPGRAPEGGGRWYPTLLTISNGQVLALTGHPAVTDTRHNNTSIELFLTTPAPLGTWSLVGQHANLQHPDPRGRQPLYPRLHLLPTGDVFCGTPMVDGTIQRWTPASNVWSTVTPAPPTDGIYHDISATSVLLPLRPSDGYHARVLLCGGSQPVLIDLGAATPTWQPAGTRALAGSPVRVNLNAVLLPTGEVFVCGGVQVSDNDATAVLAAELYKPATNIWETCPAASVVRNYHSVALLMPDGRVWTAGSNIDAQPGLANRELRIEIYEPWYYCADRPTITSAPGTISLRTSFNIRTPRANEIRSVSIIRAGSVTHAYNGDQRYVELTIRSRTSDTLTVDAPPDNHIAPPGYYLLFIEDNDGVPSVGRFVRVPLRR